MGRQLCDGCRRPLNVCICDSLPRPRLRLSTPVVVLQHPREAKRKVQTAPLLELCVEPECLAVVRGRSPSALASSSVWTAAMSDGRTPLLLYPRAGAMRPAELTAAVAAGERFVLLALDGNWQEASRLLANDRDGPLTRMRALDIGCPDARGLFAARKPPKDGCFSTVEAVAFALDSAERQPVSSALIRPMLRVVQQHLALASEHGGLVHRPEKPGYRTDLEAEVRPEGRQRGAGP